MVGLSWLFFKSCEPHALEADSPIQKHTRTVEIDSDTGIGAAADAWTSGILRGNTAQDLN